MCIKTNIEMLLGDTKMEGIIKVKKHENYDETPDFEYRREGVFIKKSLRLEDLPFNPRREKKHDYLKRLMIKKSLRLEVLEK